jgi:hypothetical protein
MVELNTLFLSNTCYRLVLINVTIVPSTSGGNIAAVGAAGLVQNEDKGRELRSME